MSNSDSTDSSEPSRLVRASTVTGGRTHSTHDDLQPETLVETTFYGEDAATSLGVLQRWILWVCREELSIAEISALLDQPLDLVKDLVAGLADEDLVTVSD
jgi:Protein of unknown function (DUF742)